MHNAPSPERRFAVRSSALRWGWFVALWAAIRVLELALR